MKSKRFDILDSTPMYDDINSYVWVRVEYSLREKIARNLLGNYPDPRNMIYGVFNGLE